MKEKRIPMNTDVKELLYNEILMYPTPEEMDIAKNNPDKYAIKCNGVGIQRLPPIEPKK